MTDVKIVKESSPGRILVANGMGKSPDRVIPHSDESEMTRLLLSQPLGP
jgi:hypothetical protein